MPTPPHVCIVVLNWNGREDTLECLRALEGLEYNNVSVVIVDNGSSDGSLEAILAYTNNSSFTYRSERDRLCHKALYVLENGENRGFAGGCNPGLRFAIEHEADYVLLLNNDAALVNPHGLEQAVRVAQDNPSIGIVGGVIVWDGQEGRLYSAGGRVSRWRGIVVQLALRPEELERWPDVREVEFVSGALMLITRRTLERVGLLCEDYFFGTEDKDYCLRARRRALRVVTVKAFTARHKGARSHGPYDPKLLYASMKSYLLFMKRYLGPRQWRVWWRLYRLYALKIRPFVLSRRYRLQYGLAIAPSELRHLTQLAFDRVGTKATEGLRCERTTEDELLQVEALVMAERGASAH